MGTPLRENPCNDPVFLSEKFILLKSEPFFADSLFCSTLSNNSLHFCPEFLLKLVPPAPSELFLP